MKRKGLGIGRGKGYYNLIPIDRFIHSLSAQGISSAPVNLSIKPRELTFSDGSEHDVPYITEPMRPVATLEVPSGDEWVAEVKKDGALSLGYFLNDKVAFINRRGVQKTFIYPELIDKEPKDIDVKDLTILQGEIITKGGTLDSFSDLLKRDLLKDSYKAKDRMHEYPLKFYVFDILMKDGKWVSNKPLKERHQIIQKLITSKLKDYEVAEQHPDAKRFSDMLQKQENHEGVVIKDKNSPYVSGKVPYWLKKKFVTQADTVVLGYEKGNGRRSAIGKIIVGIYEKGKIKKVARVGSGFTDDQLANMKRRLDKGDKLFATVEYLSKTAEGKLRNPVFVGIREDIRLKDTHY